VAGESCKLTFLGDAYKLAELLYFKPRLLHPIQHRSREAQVDPSWIREREVLVESRTQLVNAIRGISKAFAERLQKCSVEAFTAKLAGQVPEAIRRAMGPLLERIDHFNEQIRYYDEMEKHIARERYPKYWLLEQVNGVEVHTALSFMLTLRDPERASHSWESPKPETCICGKLWLTVRITFWDGRGRMATSRALDNASANGEGRMPRSVR
jgi:hypothetical protein